MASRDAVVAFGLLACLIFLALLWYRLDGTAVSASKMRVTAGLAALWAGVIDLGADKRHARRHANALAAQQLWPGSGLHVCASCRGDFVHASERRRESEVCWWMRLRCGQCGGCRDVIVSDDVARRFDADVSRGLAAIEGAVTALDRERMADQADTFAAALRHDLIDAGDFRP